MKSCVEPHSANTLIDGLKDVVHYSRSNFDKEFESCTASRQVAILKHFEEKGHLFTGLLGKVQKKYLGFSFFYLLREYTVRFYITSELGGTKGLAYVPIPGSFHGCIPKNPGQRAWATI